MQDPARLGALQDSEASNFEEEEHEERRSVEQNDADEAGASSPKSVDPIHLPGQ